MTQLITNYFTGIGSYTDTLPDSTQTYYYRMLGTNGTLSTASAPEDADGAEDSTGLGLASKIVAPLGFTAYRAGGDAGQAVSQTVVDSGDPTQYVLFVDDGDAVDPTDGTPDDELPPDISGGYLRGESDGVGVNYNCAVGSWRLMTIPATP